MSNDDLVYSSGPGTAEDKRKRDGRSSKEAAGKGGRRSRKAGRAANAAPPDPADGVARVRRETKGRGGKTVTVITGLPLPAVELGELAKELRRLCGSGGSCKSGVIEIQGDHADRMVEELATRGHKVKRAGG